MTMTFNTLLLLVLGGVFANNYALEKFLGVTPLLGASKTEGKALRLGAAVAVVILLTSALAWPVQTYLLAPLSLDYLQTLVFAALILIVVYLVELLAKAAHLSLGVYFPLIALNSAVLGAAVNSMGAGYTFLETLLSSLGVGLGFLFALLIFSGVQTRIDQPHVPKAFRGLPVSLLAACIVSMVLVAFK